MNLIKIALTMGKRFSEFYDIKKYRKQTTSHIIVRKYNLSSSKIVLNEGK